MSCYAIIPARKGSKRLPGKNARVLGEKPLIQWTIECALSSNLFEKVVVSTDDLTLASLSESLGCFIPGLREESLASDHSNLASVCLDVADKMNLKSSDVIMLLQPTSPFRKIETMERALTLLKENKEAASVISFSPCPLRPEWIHKAGEKGFAEPLADDPQSLLRQRASHSYIIPNGLIYLISVENLKRYQNFFTPFMLPIVTDDPIETHDIDDLEDWEQAESYLQLQAGDKKVEKFDLR